MEQGINITDAEWKIMEFIWDNPGVTMGQIRKAFLETGWSDSTIKTLVLRLTRKGALKLEGKARNNKYFAAVSADECRKQELKNFIDRIFGGSVKMMVSNLIEDSSLSQKDIGELMSIIDKIED